MPAAARSRPALATLALALALAAGLAHPAAAQDVEFRGFGYVYGFNAPCTADGWAGTPGMNVRYRPHGLGSNDDSRLVFFDRHFAAAFRLYDGRFDRNWRDVEAGQIGSSLWEYDEGATQLRVTTQIPPSPTATTPQIRLVGQIRGWGGVPGCIASFEVTAILRR